MAHQIIDASRWDTEPVRGVLVALLTGNGHVRGDFERELLDAEHEGLLEYESTTWGNWTKRQAHLVWSVNLTMAGRDLALRLGRSEELCEVIEGALGAGRSRWGGIHPGDVFAELDLRDGGSGRVRDWTAWTHQRGRDYIRQLPRRHDSPVEDLAS
jgi:hypothetical protein